MWYNGGRIIKDYPSNTGKGVFMNSNFKEIVEVLSSILGVAATIAGAILGCIGLIKKHFGNKVQINTYYITRGVFSDRINSFEELKHAISTGARIINVFGKRGIGKSAFLRFFCDSINNKLNHKNKRKRKKMKMAKGLAIYIEISSYGNISISEQILRTVADKHISISQYIEELLSKTKYKKNIYIVLDNVNTSALGKEIEAVIDLFFSHSPKFCIIIGSIEKQPFINSINENIIEYLQLNVFDESDIFDYAEKNECDVSTETIFKVLSFSEGLPIFVSLLLKNLDRNPCFDDERMEKYMERIYNDLSSASKRDALYIAFLSITNVIIKISMLQCFIFSISEKEILELENSSLIEYDAKNATLKMHELFRNYIVKNYSTESEIVGSIYYYYNEKNMIFEKTYYMLMLNYENKNTEIIRAIEKAIKEENFSFLLLLGEHYKLLYNWEKNMSGIEVNTFLFLIYGYTSGLIGIGDYPAARDVVDRCRISANSPETVLQFEFSLVTAQLYHLQNEYELAIETYHILLNNITNNSSFEKYESKCFWGIAHSLRHEGYDLDRAIDFYDCAISAAQKHQRESDVLKSMMEKLNIYIFQRKTNEARNIHKEIVERIRRLPADSYTGTKISFMKLESRYVRLMIKSNSNLQLKLLQKTLTKYKEQRKRLQYNTYFELGEYYRKLGRYKDAKDNYNKALNFSQQNYDYNLKTLSQIALIVVEISGGDYIREQLISKTIATFQESESNNLYINKLLAEMILGFLLDEVPDTNILFELSRLQYMSAIDVYNQNSYIAYRSLDLFLM